MKKFLTLIIFLALWSGGGIAQVMPRTVGDTLGPWTVISFEEPTEFVTIAATPGNIWQIGHPQKSFFNQAYTIPNAMVTDTLGYYPVNNLSSFDLLISQANTAYQYPMDLFIDFYHKIDSDTLQDGGFISVSWDLGQTWNNILDDTLSFFWFVSPAGPNLYGLGNTNLYNGTDTLCNGEHGFSGRSNGWVHSCLAWYDLPVKSPDFYWPPDTMLLRFSFVSDGIQNNREGWMIDQIRLFSIDLGSGTGETSSLKASVSPNPVTKNSVITLDRICREADYSLCDLTGRIILNGRCENSDRFSIQNNGMIPGIYLLKITTETSRSATLKIFFDNP